MNETVDSHTVLSKKSMEIKFQNGRQLRLHDNSTQLWEPSISPGFTVT